MYCEVPEGNCTTHTEGSHNTLWHSVFKHQDDANTQAQDEFAQISDVDDHGTRFFTETINPARPETSKLTSGVSQSLSSTLPSDPSSEKMQNTQLDLEYMSQASNDESMNSFKRHGRAILTVAQVQAIFRYKSASFAKDSEKAGALARMYGVCVKTVRDIWGGRTWYRATFHLDQSKPFTPERLQKKAGRPKGAKDRKPRARKITFDSSCVDDSYCRLEGMCDSPSLCKSSESSDWTDFPPATCTIAQGFEDPFEEDWNQWLQEDREGAWQTESPATSDEDDAD
jgi:hypothetical protein